MTTATLTRTPHWATRELDSWLAANAERPFAWGSFDCCLAPADAIRSFTGVDLAAPLRGEYTDARSALLAIARVCGGGKSIEDAIAWCAARAGLAEWHSAKFAQRGDLVLLLDSSGAASDTHAGIVHTNGRHVVTAGESGLRRYPISAARRAWKV